MFKYALVLLTLAMAQFAQAETTIWKCATSLGGYNEVQKFQIVESDNDFTVKIWGFDSAAGDYGRIEVGGCEAQQDTLVCEFNTQKSIRTYHMKLRLENPNRLSGTIKQFLRPTGYVGCRITDDSFEM